MAYSTRFVNKLKTRLVLPAALEQSLWVSSYFGVYIMLLPFCDLDTEHCNDQSFATVI